MLDKGKFLIPGVIYGFTIAFGIIMILIANSAFSELFEDILACYIVIKFIIVFWADGARRKVEDDYVSHYTFIIRTFYIWWLYMIMLVAFIYLFAFFHLGFSYNVAEIEARIEEFPQLGILAVAILVWFYVRNVRGLRASLRRKPINNPFTWGF